MTVEKQVMLPIGATTARPQGSGYGEAGASHKKNAFKGFDAKSISPNLDIDLNNRTLRSRARMLYMSAPFATSAIRTMRTNTVGIGLIPRTRVNAKYLGLNPEQARALNELVDMEWKLWAEDARACDATGLDDFYGLQQLAFLSWQVSGDTFALKKLYDPTFLRPYSLRWHILEADRCCTPTENTWAFPFITNGKNPDNGNKIHDGVEYDSNGLVVAYHICNGTPLDYTDSDPPKWVRVPAVGEKTELPNILHIMDRERPDQYRGVSLLAQVIELLLQSRRYGEAEVMAAVLQTYYTLIIETGIDPTGNPLMSKAAVAEGSTNADEVKIGPGAVVGLKPGEKVTAIQPTHPHTGYDVFQSAQGSEIGAALEIPGGLLMKKFNASYSATRGELLEFHKAVRMKAQWFIADFCRPAREAWFTEAVARGRIIAPGFFDDPLTRAAYLGCEWIAPAAGQIDPVKEVQALSAAIKEGLITREAAARQYNGSDFMMNAAQLKDEQAMLGAPAPTQQTEEERVEALVTDTVAAFFEAFRNEQEAGKK
jgi:lambda family phage portal protein